MKYNLYDYSLHAYPGENQGSSGFCHSLKVGDVTGDGKDDIIVSQTNPGRVFIISSPLDWNCGAHNCPICDTDDASCHNGVGHFTLKATGMPSIISGLGDVDGDGDNDLMLGTNYFINDGNTYSNALLVFKGPINSDKSFNDFSTGYYLDESETDNQVNPPVSLVYNNYDGDRYLVIGNHIYNGSFGRDAGEVCFINNSDIDMNDNTMYDLDHECPNVGFEGAHYGYSLSTIDDVLAIGEPGGDAVSICNFLSSLTNCISVSTHHISQCQDSVDCLGRSIDFDNDNHNILYAIDKRYNRLQLSRINMAESNSDILSSIIGENNYDLSQVVSTDHLGMVYALGIGTSGKSKVYLLNLSGCTMNSKPNEPLPSPVGVIMYGNITRSTSYALPGEPLMCRFNVSDPDPGDVLNLTVWTCNNDGTSCSISDSDYNATLTCVQGINCSNVTWNAVPSSGVTAPGQWVCKLSGITDQCGAYDLMTITSNVITISKSPPKPPCLNLTDVMRTYNYNDSYHRVIRDNNTATIYFVKDTTLCRGVYNLTESQAQYSSGGNIYNHTKSFVLVLNTSDVELDLNGSTLIYTIGTSRVTHGEGLASPSPGYSSMTVLDGVKNIKIENGVIRNDEQISGGGGLGSKEETLISLGTGSTGTLNNLTLINITGGDVYGFKGGIAGYMIGNYDINNIKVEGNGKNHCRGINLVINSSELNISNYICNYSSTDTVTGCYCLYLGPVSSKIYLNGLNFDGSNIPMTKPIGNYDGVIGLQTGNYNLNSTINIKNSYMKRMSPRGIYLPGQNRNLDVSMDNVTVLETVTNTSHEGIWGIGIDIKANKINLKNVTSCWSGSGDISITNSSTLTLTNNTCNINDNLCQQSCACAQNDNPAIPNEPAWYSHSQAYNYLRKAGIGTWIPSIGMITEPASSTYTIDNPGIYRLCGDRYTQGDNIIINSDNVTLDCGGHVVKNKGANDELNAKSSIKINSAKNVKITGCNSGNIPFYPWAPGWSYSLLLTGASDNITIQDSNFTYDVKINNSGDNLFDGVRFDNPSSSPRYLQFYDGISKINNSNISLKRVEILGNSKVTIENSNLSSLDNIKFEEDSNSLLTNVFVTGNPEFKIISNNNNDLIINNLRNETNISNEIISNTSFGIRFDNLTLAHPENNPFVLEVDDGFAKVNQSELKRVRQQGSSKLYLLNSNITDKIKLYERANLLSQGSITNQFNLQNGNNIKYIGPMQWYDNITADSDIAQFMVGRLHFIYTHDNQHAVRCGLAVITDSSGHEHKCVMTPDNYGWLYVDENYTGLSSGDVLLNYTYKVKTLGDGIHKQNGSGIYKTTDECRHDLESFGAIDSSTLNCTVLTPDIHGDIGNITDPCPFQTKPDGYHYKCYNHINDWAKNWNFDGSGEGWFSEYGLPVPSHYLEES